MTWSEFKRQVESSGVSDEMEILYIDISYPDEIIAHTESIDGMCRQGVTIL